MSPFQRKQKGQECGSVVEHLLKHVHQALGLIPQCFPAPREECRGAAGQACRSLGNSRGGDFHHNPVVVGLRNPRKDFLS